MSLVQTYAEQAASVALHKRQDELVGEALKRTGELVKDHLYNVGLDGVGRILNPAQRIRELRLKGWRIKTVTDRGKCTYVLVSTPGGFLPERENAPSFLGFGRYMRRRGIQDHAITPARRAELYQDYCDEIRGV